MQKLLKRLVIITALAVYAAAIIAVGTATGWYTSELLIKQEERQYMAARMNKYDNKIAAMKAERLRMEALMRKYGTACAPDEQYY